MATKKAETTKKKTTTKTASKKPVKKSATKAAAKPKKIKEPVNEYEPYIPKAVGKPVSKNKLNQFIKFFTENSKYIRLANYTFSGDVIIRVLEERGDELFINLDNRYYIYDRADKTVLDFGDIFEIGIDSMMHVPWQKPEPTPAIDEKSEEDQKEEAK